MGKAAICAVDLFCGVGGLTHGLVQGGVSVLAGVDSDGACRFPYEANNDATFLERDVRGLQASEVASFFEGVQGYRLLAGCAPCQPFSTYSQKGRHARSDGKWNLLAEFARVVEGVRPEFVTMENVPQLARHAVFEGFLQALAGYHVWHDVVDCVDYGIPQTRKRLVLVASLLRPIALREPDRAGGHVATVRDVLGGLPALAAGQTDPCDAMHAASALSPLNLCRIRASRPGGTWRDWPEDLRAGCHAKETGQTYPSVYGRMEWDAPAPTITTQCFGFGNGRFGHPEQDRAISLREAAILQTFPSGYKFVPEGGRVRFHTLGRLIGNAVPVQLGKVIAETFIRHAGAGPGGESV